MIAGQKVGKLTLLKPFTRKYWCCRCECGLVIDVREDSLKQGSISRSCGCARRRIPPNGNRRHGLSHTPENSIWRSIVGRCTIPSHTSYDRYGARGIYVCERWLRDFVAFYQDMGPRPSRRHSVERKNNNGPYSPTNCFWATPKVQGNNKRNNHLLTHHGITKTLTQWGDELGIDSSTLRRRLKLGWSVERTLTTPLRATAASYRRRLVNKSDITDRDVRATAKYYLKQNAGDQ